MLFGSLMLLLAPAQAMGEIYKWIDGRGVTVLSNSPPDDESGVAHLEVASNESKRAGVPGSAATERDITPTEQMLLERVEKLERELKAEQHAREAAIAERDHVMYATPYPVHGGTYASAPYPSGYYPYATPLIPVYPAVSTIVVSKSPFHPRGFRHGFHRGGVFFHRGFASVPPRSGVFPHTGFPRVAPHSGFTRPFSGSGFTRGGGARGHARR